MLGSNKNMDSIWTTVHQERQSLIDDLSGIAADQWNTQSLCDDWTVHDVLAHLVDDAKTTKAGFVRNLILARFNFDRANENGVHRERKDIPGETLEAFRQVSNRTSSAPAPLASRLVEIVVHGEDIRRPLGISHTYPVEAIIAAIDYQLATSDSMGGSKDRAAALKLIANDADWSHGSGAEVRGDAIEILMTLTRRPVSNGALEGAGVASL